MRLANTYVYTRFALGRERYAWSLIKACLVVEVIPVPILMEVVVTRLVMVVIAMPVVFTRVVIPMARVMPHMPTTPMPTVVRLIGVTAVAAVVAIASAVPPVSTMGIADIDMHAPATDVNSLRLGFTQIHGGETRG